MKIRYEPIGCFNDRMKNPRPLPVWIKSFRGGRKDWSNFNDTIEACAKEALDKNYLYFGLQFYGECWSGPQAHLTYDEDGISNRCTLGVGGKRANMVYKLAGKGELQVKWQDAGGGERRSRSGT